mmetsp:Transcript_4907/g.7263  ORF Transcript_4907/g.7263 Transcript_4907/m.7263 type:complete len:461 (+) Transcript_4907:134-1516(+)
MVRVSLRIAIPIVVVGSLLTMLYVANEITHNIHTITKSSVNPHVKLKQLSAFKTSTNSTVLRRATVTEDSAIMEHMIPDKTEQTRGILSKDVVLGMAKGIAPKPLALFLASLRKYCEDTACDVILWVEQQSIEDEKVNELLKKHMVEVKVFSPDTLEPEYARGWHPSSYRWLLIHEFLSKEASRRDYRAVLLADVRDTAFQDNPFKIIDENGNGFYASSEDLDTPKKSINDCGWNSGWIESCYGPVVLKKVGSNPIICSGMSIATLSEAVAYSKAMYDKLVSPSGQACERNGVDQGMHNVLVWTNAIQNLNIVTQESGLIANMQSKHAVVKEMGGGLVVINNKKGEKMYIVHQYDRDLSVLKSFEKEYVDWVPEKSKECKMFDLDESGKDLFAGRCDLGLAGGATSIADCCRACRFWESCKGFAFSMGDGKCYMKNCNNVGKNFRVTPLRGGGGSGWSKV